MIFRYVSIVSCYYTRLFVRVLSSVKSVWVFLFNHNKLVPEKAFALIYYFNPIQIDARQIDFAKKE